MGSAEDLAQLERQLRDLRIEYEQYFAGILKQEPVKLREHVAKLIRQYSGVTLTNTGQSFRLNSLTATFNSYIAYWDRVVRQIEEGTYSRDKFRLKLKEREQRPTPGGGAPDGPTPAPADAVNWQAGARFRPGTEPGGRELQGLYEALVAAKRQAGESTQGLKPESLAAAIKQQLPQIQKRFNCESVEFKVVVEDGKAKLKATPK